MDGRTAATGTFQRTEASSVPLVGAQRLSGRCILDDLHKEVIVLHKLFFKVSRQRSASGSF